MISQPPLVCASLATPICLLWQCHSCNNEGARITLCSLMNPGTTVASYIILLLGFNRICFDYSLIIHVIIAIIKTSQFQLFPSSAFNLTAYKKCLQLSRITGKYGAKAKEHATSLQQIGWKRGRREFEIIGQRRSWNLGDCRESQIKLVALPSKFSLLL